MASARKQPGKILDLFAGAGGWEEGLSMLGLSALGIETEPWACETARAAGHERLQADVTALDPLQFSPVWELIGSPPCQAYSNAGKGLGRADKPLVVACAHELAAGHDSRGARLKECRDPRSLLTVEPLRFALALKPRWVALEQVPAVLELWTLLAALLCAHGYQAAVGVLSAERYGVPQTRKRAFLIASLDGPVALPDPTHRSYNPRRQDTPEDELLLEPWVSMAEALGWTPTEEVGFPRRNDTPSNHPSKADTGTYRRRDRRPACKPAPTLTAKTRSWTRKPCVHIRRSGQRITEGFDPTSAPAQAITTRVNRWQAHGVKGGWAWRNGNQRNAAVRAAGEPAPTVHFGHALNQIEWVPTWAGERPATTVACDRRVHPPGPQAERLRSPRPLRAAARRERRPGHGRPGGGPAGLPGGLPVAGDANPSVRAGRQRRPAPGRAQGARAGDPVEPEDPATAPASSGVRGQDTRGTVVSVVVRLWDRLWDRLRDRLRDCLRDPLGSAGSPGLRCSQAGFRGCSLCDISMSVGDLL